MFLIGGGGYQEVSLFPQSNSVNIDPIFGGVPPPTLSVGGSSSFGEVLQPVLTGPLVAPVSQPKRLTSDVDSSLAQAAANLSLELTGGGGSSSSSNTGIHTINKYIIII